MSGTKVFIISARLPWAIFFKAFSPCDRILPRQPRAAAAFGTNAKRACQRAKKLAKPGLPPVKTGIKSPSMNQPRKEFPLSRAVS